MLRHRGHDPAEQALHSHGGHGAADCDPQREPCQNRHLRERSGDGKHQTRLRDRGRLLPSLLCCQAAKLLSGALRAFRDAEDRGQMLLAVLRCGAL